MRRGCLYNLLFGVLLLIVFGGSTYFWFTFFVKGRSLPTPNLVGRSITQARAMAQDLGVTLVVDDEHRRNSDKVPIGNIVWQNRQPGATSFIKRGSTIKVELSAGPLVLRVPDFAGQTSGTAILRLGQQNMKLDRLAYVETGVNSVLAADPPQAPISLLVSVPKSSTQYVMPDLIDRSFEQVRPALERRGLVIGTVKYEAYPGIPDGIIIRQYPLRGAPVSGRDPITLVVSRQEETSIIENPPVTAPPVTTQ
jgi:serine/threonine-protein kinase